MHNLYRFFSLLNLLCLPSLFIQAQTLDNQFRLISYNVQGLPVPFKLDHSKLPFIARSLPSFEPDVVVFQETFTKRSHVLEKIKGLSYVAHGNPKHGFKFQSAGLMTASKHEIINIKRIQYNKCAGTDCLAAKGALLTTLLLPDGRLVDVYNTHLNAGKNKKVKWSQLSALMQFIRQNDQGRLTFVAGDFNIVPESDYYRYLTRDMGLVDTHTSFVQDNPDLDLTWKKGYTHSSKRPFKKELLKRKLDYVFVINPQGHAPGDVLYSRPHFDGSHDDNRYSDHFALVMDHVLE